MKQIAVVAAAAVLLACPHKPSGKEQLERDAKEVGQKIDEAAKKVRASDAGQRIAKGAHEAGQGIKQGAGELTEKAGQSLQKAGAKLKEKAKGE